MKKVETVTCRKVLQHYLAFDQKSERKLLNLTSADSFFKNNAEIDIFLILKKKPLKCYWFSSVLDIFLCECG